jgi:hypothetical protein
MRIVQIDEYEDGTKVAIVADEDGNIVGQNVYGPDSHPQPVVSGEETIWRKIADWWRA